jgi:hypothetical protein
LQSTSGKLFFLDCSECPGPTNLENTLEDVFSDNAIENITFKQWISTARRELITIVKSTEELIESLLINCYFYFVIHSFIATQQAMFFKELKSNLQSGEFVVLCYFTENYSFILQGEAQGFHWNSAQATIHPVVIYLKKANALNAEHENLVMISDCLKHDSILVLTFQRHLKNFIENTFESPLKKIVYFCCGSAAQYKNRKKLTKYYMPQLRLWSASNILWEECL